MIKYQDIIWKAGVIALLFANLFLKVNYVSRDEYKADKEKNDAIINRLDSNLTAINLTLTGISFQTKTIEDHELRIRKLESK